MAVSTRFLPKIFGDFICTRCGCRTEELKWDIEPHGEAVVYDVCSCGGQYDNAVRCEHCGEYIPESEAQEDEDGYTVCEECNKIF